MRLVAHVLFLLIVAVLCDRYLKSDDSDYNDDCTGSNEYMCNDGQCIQMKKVCDGFYDCRDRSDEDLCGNQTSSLEKCDEENRFFCESDKKCIPHSLVCNGYNDCSDNSDEKDCSTVEFLQNSSCTGFLCNSTECISNHWVCDGHRDCYDQSDETNDACRRRNSSNSLSEPKVSICPDIENKQVTQMFQCRDTSFCLDMSEVCNKMDDCKDGSDEHPYCGEGPPQCDNVTCEGGGICVPTYAGARCKCNNLYAPVNSSCDTADYCEGLPLVCSQICENDHTLQSRYKCRCNRGYRPVGNMCYATIKDNTIIYFATDTQIRSIDVEGKSNYWLTEAKMPRSITTDGDILYWIELAQGNHIVMKGPLVSLDKDKEVLLSIGMDEPDDIAVDWEGNNIYLTEAKQGYIAICTTMGIYCKRIRNETGIKHPRHITLDPDYGLMFWADDINTPRIQRADMDVTNIVTLTYNRRHPPSAVATDSPSRKLYYAEPEYGITVINMDGTGKYQLKASFIYTPNTLLVFENDLYWDDSSLATIQVSTKMEGLARRKILANLRSQESIKATTMYHPSLYLKRRRECDDSLCDHLCVLTINNKYTCLCSENSKYRKHQYTCDEYDPKYYLLVGGGPNISAIHFHTLTRPEKEFKRLDIGWIKTMSYDPYEDVVYILDGGRKIVYKFPPSNFSAEAQVLPIFGMQVVQDMDFDFLARNLYFVDFSHGVYYLSVYSLTTKNFARLLTFESNEIPIDLCAVPAYGELLIAIQYVDKDIITVEKFGMDGNARRTMYTTKFQGGWISLSHSMTEDLTFIADTNKGAIYVVHPTYNMTASKRRDTEPVLFHKLTSQLKSITLADQMVFWTDFHSPLLYWKNYAKHSDNLASMNLTKFINNVQIHVTAVTPLFNESQHICVKNPSVCSHTCVQTFHDIPNYTEAYKCVCPVGQVAVNNNTNKSSIAQYTCAWKKYCSSDQLECFESNSCYEKKEKCDGKSHCENEEDELDCDLLQDKACAITEFKCPNSGICMKKEQLCDGHEDCPDGSDELSMQCPPRPCKDTEFLCPGGICIVQQWVCDGDYDCKDGSDEANCGDVKFSCPESLFKCNSEDSCWDMNKRCDGYNDCDDWSDEENCQPDGDDTHVIRPDLCSDHGYLYHCPNNMSSCFKKDPRCNGLEECPDGVDEIGCTGFKCDKDYFQCDKWEQCVDYAFVCDQQKDCEDGSDETLKACHHKRNLTSTDNYTSTIETKCQYGFPCYDSTCVDWKNVCDDYPDCRDHDDEGKLCEMKCDDKKCHHYCKSTPVGPQCLCHKGYKIEVNSNLCEDVDECSVFKQCSHLCHNTIGSYKCSCYNGYALRKDGHSCKSTRSDTMILYATDSMLKSVRPHETRAAVNFTHPDVSHILDINYDPRTKSVYIATGKELFLVSKEQISNLSSIGRPILVAPDWITGNFFVINSYRRNQSIAVCNVEKQVCATMHYISHRNKIQAFTIDSINRKIFYCSQNSKSLSESEIYEVDLDIYRKKATVINIVVNCTGLTVDYQKQILYVAQGNGNITQMGYNGLLSQDVIIGDSHISNPKGLQLFEDFLYTIDTSSQKISRCYLFAARRCETHISKVFKAKAFVIQHDHIEHEAAFHHCFKPYGNPECWCHQNQNINKTDLCIRSIPESEFFTFKIVKYYKESKSYSTNNLVIILTSVISSILGCCLCFLYWSRDSINFGSWLENRTDRVRPPPARPRSSWWSSQGAPPSTEEADTRVTMDSTARRNSPVIDIQLEQPARRLSVFNTSFVNWLYSSINRRRNRQNEPRVHYRPPGPIPPEHAETTEPLAGPPAQASSSGFSPQAILSDTESEIDDKEHRT